MKFTNDHWNVVTYLDISHIKPHLDQVEALIKEVSEFCTNSPSNKIQLECSNLLSPLQNQHLNNVRKFSSVSYLVQDQIPNRFKRGLIDAGGSLLKSIFGTLDSEDALKFSEAITKVQTDEKQLAHLMRDNIHVIKSTISNFNNTMSKVNKNQNQLNKNLDTIRNAFVQLSNTTDKLEIKNHLIMLLNTLESITVALSFDIDDVNNAVLFSKLNILHPAVLSPYQLFQELDLHKDKLPKHCELPTSLSLETIHIIIDISDLVCYYHLNKIIIITKIPLVLPQTYNLYHTVPLPVPYDATKPDTYILIAPNKPYVAITIDRMFYSLLESVDKCQVIHNECYVCSLGNVYSTIANPTCETKILTEAISSLPHSCNTKLLHGSIDVFFKLNNNKWLFVQSEPGKAHITCENDPSNYDEIFFGTGMLFLPKYCVAFYKTLKFTPSDNVVTNVTNHVSNFNIVKDDCCDNQRINKTILHLPFVKLSNVNDFNSLLQASVHLNEFEKELNKIEQPSHLQKFSTHYMSLTYVISSIVLIYFLYKSRKLLCKTKPQLCIQVFNQCNTKRKQTVQSVQSVSCSTESSDEDVQGSCKSLPTPLRRNVIT